MKSKCSYYNSVYCKFSRKESGCRFVDPEENCKLSKCKDKLCPKGILKLADLLKNAGIKPDVLIIMKKYLYKMKP